jgi:hypothetical protein
MFDEVYSDPGSDLTSEAVKQLNDWLGVSHKVSLVDRHESNGVEGTNKLLLRHLTILVNEERLKDRWSEPSVLCLINFALNDAVSSESGVRPFDAKFGTVDGTYFRLPEVIQPGKEPCEFIKLLNADLQTVREASKKFQEALVKERTARDHPANEYQRGDFVLLQWPPDRPKPSKLSAQYLGPYEVITQSKNDVECRHLGTGAIRIIHVSRLKIFHGDRETATEMAFRDDDQFRIVKILAYRGDPMQRTTMEFLVEFADGDKVWLLHTRDLSSTVQFEAYCRANRPLFPLIYTVQQAMHEISVIKKQEIEAVQPGDAVYVDLRWYGATFYSELGLPEADFRTYVVVYKYVKWSFKTNHKRIDARCEVFDEYFSRLDNYFVYTYGSVKNFDAGTMTLVDEAFCVNHPTVLPSATAATLLRKYVQRIQQHGGNG